MVRTMALVTIIGTSIIGSFVAAQGDLSKVKECNGRLDYRPLFDKREDELQFYMQTTAKSEEACVHMCYEKLHFCYTVMYKTRADNPTADGVCYFGYYRPDGCDPSSTPTDAADAALQSSSNGEQAKANTNSRMFTCISCKENPPSFVQEVDENRVGPARLIKPADNPSAKQPHSVSGTEGQTNISVPNHILYLRESKAFSYLMPKCNGKLSYGLQPTLMNRKPKIYAATNETTSNEECAHFCFRQHFCASAFFHNNNCLLSYEASVCANDTASLPIGYTGSVLISCIECRKDL